MKIEEPIAFNLLFGTKFSVYNALMRPRSASCIAAVELAIAGTLVLATIELIVRSALSLLAYLPTRITKSARAFYSNKFVGPALLTFYALKYGVPLLRTNLKNTPP